MTRFAFTAKWEQVARCAYEALAPHIGPDDAYEIAKKAADIWAAKHEENLLTGDYHLRLEKSPN
jgi:hypothetical protein